MVNGPGSSTGFEPPVAVIDSNVLIEATSCVDVFRHYLRDNFEARSADATLRRQKARESLLLSVYLDSIGATTFSLNEAYRITLRTIVPGDLNTLENLVLATWAHYVKARVLPNWTITLPATGEGEPTGNDADALLVRRAKEYDVPLISHEGVKVTGIDEDWGIRKRARAEGVRVLAPREFYPGSDELLLSAQFLQRFDDGLEEYVREFGDRDGKRENMLDVRHCYLHILYGVSDELAEPLPIRLSASGVGLTVEQCTGAVPVRM